MLRMRRRLSLDRRGRGARGDPSRARAWSVLSHGRFLRRSSGCVQTMGRGPYWSMCATSGTCTPSTPSGSTGPGAEERPMLEPMQISTSTRFRYNNRDLGPIVAELADNVRDSSTRRRGSRTRSGTASREGCGVRSGPRCGWSVRRCTRARTICLNISTVSPAWSSSRSAPNRRYGMMSAAGFIDVVLDGVARQSGCGEDRPSVSTRGNNCASRHHGLRPWEAATACPRRPC